MGGTIEKENIKVEGMFDYLFHAFCALTENSNLCLRNYSSCAAFQMKHMKDAACQLK